MQFISPHCLCTYSCVTDPHIFLMKFCQGVPLLGLECFHINSRLTMIAHWCQCIINAWWSWFHLNVLLLLLFRSLLGILLEALGLLMPLFTAEDAHVGTATIAKVVPFSLVGTTAVQIPIQRLHSLTSYLQTFLYFLYFHGRSHHLQRKKDEPCSHAFTLY